MAALPPRVEPSALAGMRRLIFAALLAGVAGMGSELMLIGHFEDMWQVVPLALLACGLVALILLAVAPSRAGVRALQALMVLFVASGALGVGLHFRGNAEFELEMYPERAGWDLVRETLAGATPVLAPGSMALLGVIGFALTFQHPALRSSRVDHGFQEVSS